METFILVIELRGVHKDAHNNYIVLCNSTLHKRCVTLMQRTHCGHKTYALARSTTIVELSTELIFSVNYNHFSKDL